MPHLIIEHSADIKSTSVKILAQRIQDIMAGVEGNFDADQCKVRTFSFDEYFVGRPDESNSSFIHITLKVLSGRTTPVRKNLSEKILEFTKKFFAELATSPNSKDNIIAVGNEIADELSGIPHIHMPAQNSDLAGKRCDLSVDIVEMDRETYQKIRIE
jgi:5-carboxymethyl-2-hydroxymuconate isomerase